MLNVQDIIFRLQQYWGKQGCSIIQPYDLEVGAGTFHPATVLFALGKKPWQLAYVQPSRRPQDSRYGDNPNRMQKFQQFQVILKPSPDNIVDLFLQSLVELGINPDFNEIKFIEDDWHSPTLGASGLGWEVWCNGMEIAQFTYMQQVGGIECSVITGELAYGIERLALFIQRCTNIYDLVWSYNSQADQAVTYRDLFLVSEQQCSVYNLDLADVAFYKKSFIAYEKEVEILLKHKLPYAAYELCMKASHVFNLLDARGSISHTQRELYVRRVRNMVKQCCQLWLEQHG